MRVRLETTDKIVELVTPTGVVPARIWEGETDSGIAVHAYITRIAVAKQEDCTQFERELHEQRAPRNPDIVALPMRLVL